MKTEWIALELADQKEERKLKRQFEERWFDPEEKKLELEEQKIQMESEDRRGRAELEQKKRKCRKK